MGKVYRDGYFTVRDGLVLHYHDYPGSAAHPSLLCLHGLTRNARDFADFAVASQYHAVKRRPQHERVDPDLLCRDPRLGFLELGPALLVLGLRGVALAPVFLRPIEIALRLLV